MNLWLAYLCAIQGHIVQGTGNSTDHTFWATHCARCGAKIA